MVRRFLLKDVGRALNHWTGLWRERQRFKLIGRRMGFDGGLSRAWRQWEHQAADDQRRKGIIGRFANVGLTRALNRWLESLEERRLMRHFLKRAMNGGLARALTSWYETMHQGALPPPLGLRARLEGVPPPSGRGAILSGRGASSKVWKGCHLRSSFIRPSARAAACRARSRPPRTAPPRLLPAPHSPKRPCATRALRRQVPQAQRVARLELLARPARGARSPEGGGAAHDADWGSEGHQPVVCVPRRAGKVSVASSSALGSSLCVVLILSLSLCAVLAAACLVVA